VLISFSMTYVCSNVENQVQLSPRKRLADVELLIFHHITVSQSQNITDSNITARKNVFT